MPRFLVKILSVFLLLVLSLVLSDGAMPAAARGSGSISGRLIQDLDGDGDMTDANEPGLAGWHVQLEMVRGGKLILHETVTNGEGDYSFSRLAPGDYAVFIPCDGQPASWLVTAPDTGGGYSTTVESDRDSGGIDFWLSLLSPTPSRNGSIVGRVAWDENRDGVPDPWEPGAVGWTVTVWLDGAVCFEPDHLSTYTSSDGSFSVSGLIPGRYRVSAISPAGPGPAGYIFDSPGTTLQQEEHDVFKYSNEVVVPADGSGGITIGVVSMEGSGSISGAIYYDLNANRIHDSNEPLVPGSYWVGLAFHTAKGYTPVFPGCCMSQGDGHYEFSGLAAGEYMVGIVNTPSPAINPPSGPDGIPDFPVTLVEDEKRTNVDFGFEFRPGSPTLDPVPTVAPSPPVAPTSPPPTPILQPIPVGNISPPVTGTGSASSGNMLVGLAAVLAVMGTLAVSGAVLLHRRQTRKEGHHA